MKNINTIITISSEFFLHRLEGKNHYGDCNE
jgi:hypothetical protein